jgi:toxin HigB-1
MIRSFSCRDTKSLFEDRRSRRWHAIAPVAFRKLRYLDAAAALQDLRVPPGNRLEALKGDLEGWWSIRVNDQWRVIFQWNEGADRVAIVDYH